MVEAMPNDKVLRTLTLINASSRRQALIFVTYLVDSDLIRCENDDGHDKGTGQETPFSVPLFTLRPFKVQQSSDDAFTYSRPARHDSPDH